MENEDHLVDGNDEESQPQEPITFKSLVCTSVIIKK